MALPRGRAAAPFRQPAPRPETHDLTPLVIAWQATLLQSSNVAYKFGVSGPFWYAAGATVQIILFAIVAIEIKRKCPAIHTMLEVVQIRWGTTAHLTFLFFGCLSSLIVTAMLILGGSATINARGHGAMCITTLIPIYEFMYPEKEEEVPAPSEEVKVAPVAFTGEQEQVMGFYQPAAGAGAAVPMAPAPQPAAVDYSQVGSA